MKRHGGVIGLAAAAVMAASSGVAVHADVSGHKLKVRKVTIKYTGACGADVTVAAGTPGVCPVGADYTLARRAGEKYLTILVKDSTTGAVSGTLWLSTGAMAQARPFCGSLKDYGMGQPTYTMNLNVAADSACPGVPTTGTITIEYSNLPVK